MAPIRKTGNTIEVATWAFNFATAVALLAIAGVGGVFLRIAYSNADLSKQVESISVAAQRDREDIAILRDWRYRHTEWGREIIGKWGALHQNHQFRLNRLEDHVNVSD